MMNLAHQRENTPGIELSQLVAWVEASLPFIYTGLARTASVGNTFREAIERGSAWSCEIQNAPAAGRVLLTMNILALTEAEIRAAEPGTCKAAVMGRGAFTFPSERELITPDLIVLALQRAYELAIEERAAHRQRYGLSV
ncbi:hypothetical protein [Chloroflexus sp.]|uniref:hypothetical protein n=1 Tax=Chloroflexus sp. TaxID=1904827 RepID=UPI002ACDAC5A|nr:hypothetical protein [Chloroflexus sp.]